MKKINVAALSAVLMLVVFGLAGCGKKTAQIEVNKYIKVEFEGYDGMGYVASTEFDARKMLNDNEGAMKDASKKDLTKLFDEKFVFKQEDLEHLKNGDKLDIKWKTDEDRITKFEKEYNVKFVYEDFDVEVSGLAKMESVDVFDGVVVNFYGTAPNGRASIESSSKYTKIEYGLDKSTGLSNGDQITITAYPGQSQYATLAEAMINNYQKIPAAETKTITVSGLSQILTSVSQIPQTTLNEMDAALKQKLATAAQGWVFPESYQGATLMGTIFAGGESDNQVDFVYKVDVDSIRDGAMSYYTYGRYTNLVMNGDGTLNVDPAAGKITGASFYAENLQYYGYEDYDTLLAKEANANYELENKVDTSIITKVTHTPKDYSRVTAVPDFDAACFAYKMVEGKYMVTGFSGKGYDLVHSYNASECISVTLPELTDAGEAVEGFYSVSSGNGTYTFAKTFDDDAPCAALVCPDSYTTFYGFGDDGANYKLRSIVLGKDIHTLRKKAFRGCIGVSKVVLPDGVDEIPESAFEGCKNLTEVTIPGGVTKIGEKAFYQCAKLETAVIPEKVMEIGNDAFHGCEKLSIAALEISGKQIGTNAFDSVTIETLMFTDNGYTSSGYTSWGTRYATWTNAHIAKIVIGENIVRIPDYAFENCAEVVDIVIPENVAEIGAGAFKGCTALNSVTVPESLVKIAESAFYGCSALKAINIPKEIKTIADYAFAGCTELSVDEFDMSKKTIGTKAFEGVTIQKLALSTEDYTSTFHTEWGTEYAPWDGATVKDIEIGAAVKRIPDYAFAYCVGLSDITIPSNVNEIGKAAFKNCVTLKSVAFHDQLHEINDQAFMQCMSLQAVEIPAATGYIGTEAFYRCNSLVIDSFELSGRKIGVNAFCQVTLNEVTLGGDAFETLRYTSWGSNYTHFTDAKIRSIVIRDGVKVVPDYAFEYVTTVAEITVPASVEQIGKQAFGNCASLRKLHLPGSLRKIDDSALTNCTDLVIYSTEDSVGKTFAEKHGFFFQAE